MGIRLRGIRRYLRARRMRAILVQVGIASLLVGLLVSVQMLVLRAPSAHAANGDVVHETHFSSPCPAGHFTPSQIGIGIAFDGANLWYSCAGTSPDLYKADPLTGTVLASYNVANGLGALAWDGVRKKMWAGWAGGSGSDGDVRLIDLANPTAAPVIFNAGAAAFDVLDDGLAYDAQDDTLYISPDTSTQIYHYSPTGTLLGSFPWGGSGCYNSGLAIGGAQLFEGSNGCNHVWVVNKSSLGAFFDFGTGADGVRDEDLECDDATFAPKTVMWSVEAYEPRRAIAFEIPAGSCGTGGGVDSDGDGLLDDWETHGVWIQPNGVGAAQFIDLPAMGADPNKPDIFVQIDWMQDATHNQSLQSSAIQKIVQSFANSPYVSPTGSVGINFHVDEGPSSILNFATSATWGALSKAQSIPWQSSLGTFSGSNYNWSAFQTIKDANFTPTGRTPIFHYVIAASQYGGSCSSGLSRDIGASDYIVSLGGSTCGWAGGTGTVNDQAGTLMHELGHNLNLHHGGGDDVNYKPNYLSIMSYAFQLQGLSIGGVGGNFDYSRSAIPALNETNLNEPSGVTGAPATYGTKHWCLGIGYIPVGNASGAIDWNCNNTPTDTGVSADINGDSLCINAGNDGVLQSAASPDDVVSGTGIYDGPNRTCNSTKAAASDDGQIRGVGNVQTSTLTGYNDWANLKFKGGSIGQAGAAPSLPLQTLDDETLTPKVASEILAAAPVPVDVKPATCPNPVNAGANGVLSVAIAGTGNAPATQIDPSSVKLAGVPALRSVIDDVATPFTPFTGKSSATDCTSAGPDGTPDLVLKFDNLAVTTAIGPLSKGQVVVVHLTGKLKDGTPIAGEDTVVVV